MPGTTRPICRFEEFTLKNSRGEPVRVVLDVCHNQPGFRAMFSTLQKTFGSRGVRVSVDFGCEAR